MKISTIKNFPATNLNKSKDALDEVQKGCNARTLKPEDIQDIIRKVEIRLHIGKKYMDGCRIVYDGSQKFPNAYRYTPECTYFVAYNKNGKWYISDIGRDKCSNRLDNVRVTLSDVAKKEIIRNFEFMEIH